MRCRTPDVDSIDIHTFRQDASARLVLLAIENADLRARFAYQLTASGFHVVTDVVRVAHDGHRPDVIVTELSGPRPSSGASIEAVTNEEGLRKIPIVALVDDVSDTTRNLARYEGCAAVCLSTCSAGTLTAGIHALLGRR